jgi:hypothetical protein
MKVSVTSAIMNLINNQIAHNLFPACISPKWDIYKGDRSCMPFELKCTLIFSITI